MTPTFRCNHSLTITKISKSSSFRSIIITLNTMLILVSFIFLVCLANSITYYSDLTSDKLLSIVDQGKNRSYTLHDEYYYDFQHYRNNVTLYTNKTNRRYIYINLGCFDGRDIDYFVYFHGKEILSKGTLHIISFEPDPTNFAACKMAQQRYKFVNGTVYKTAAWITDGKVPYMIENGQKSGIDNRSAVSVPSIDFSQWLKENVRTDDYVYIKFTIDGVEIPVLEKMVLDQSLFLVDHMEIEWNEKLSPDLEVRRIVLECMFDRFGLDYLYMINPVDLRYVFNIKETYYTVPKDENYLNIM